MNKRLYKSNNDKIIFGVLGGIGEFFSIDPTVVRIAYMVLSIMTIGLGGVILYIAMALIMPNEYRD